MDILIKALTQDGMYKGDIEQQNMIKAIVEVYHTLVSERPYTTHDQAVALIKKGRGAPFDPKIIKAFLSVEKYIWLESVKPRKK